MTGYYHLFPYMTALFIAILVVFKLLNLISKAYFNCMLTFGIVLFCVYSFTQSFIISVFCSAIAFEFVYWIDNFLKKKRVSEKSVSAIAVCDFKDKKGIVLYNGNRVEAVCIDTTKHIIEGEVVRVAFDNGHTLFVVK